LGTALSGLGTIAGRRYQFEICRDYFRRAVLHLKHAGDPGELIEAYSRIGILAFMADEYIGAKQALELGLQVQTEQTDGHSIEAWINLSTRLCIIQCYMGFVTDALALSQKMVDKSLQVPLEPATVQANTMLALALYSRGNFQESVNTAIAVRAMAERHNIHFWMSLLDIILGRCYLMTGNIDKSWLHLNSAIDREQGDPYGKLYDQARFSKGDLYRLSGDYQNAVLLYKAVIDTGLINYQTIEALHHLGLTQTYMGRVAEGEKNIHKSIVLAKQKGLTGSEYSARLTLAFTRDGAEFPEPLDSIYEMIAEMKTKGMMYANEYDLLLHARLMELKDTSLAIPEFERAAEAARGSGALWLEYYAMGKVLSLSGKKHPSGVQARVRIDQIATMLSANAKSPAVRAMFRKFPKIS
jgi:tetratricopeptide (TPR) repeat protein